MLWSPTHILWQQLAPAPRGRPTSRASATPSPKHRCLDVCLSTQFLTRLEGGPQFFQTVHLFCKPEVTQVSISCRAKIFLDCGILGPSSGYLFCPFYLLLHATVEFETNKCD